MSLPRNQGDVSSDVVATGGVKTERAKFTAADLTRDYVLFNHGIIFGPVGFSDPSGDLLVDWFNRLGDLSQHVLRQPVHTPIFRGLDGLAAEGQGYTWNNIFCAVRRELWPSLCKFLCEAVITNTKADLLFTLEPLLIHVPDPIVVDRFTIHTTTSIPTVPIWVFGCNCNTASFRINQEDRYQPRMEVQPPYSNREQIWWDQIKAGDFSEVASREVVDMHTFVKQHETLRQKVMLEGPERNYERIDE